MKHFDVIIIGAGPAGMSAACNIVKYSTGKPEVLIVEHKDKPGKKLLATGNGRCNFTNDILDKESYRGSFSDFAYNLIKEYDKGWLTDFMYSLGIIHIVINGYYYPRSLQAASVNDALLNKLSENDIEILAKTHVKAVKHNKEGYIVETDNGQFMSNKVVIATGGRSYSKLGSDGSGYSICRELNHTVTPTVPALCALKLTGFNFKRTKGVRAKGCIKLISDGKVITESAGELQFADYGLSGIPVFQISRYAGYLLAENKKCTVSVDLACEYSEKELAGMLYEMKKNNPGMSAAQLIAGLLPYKLSEAIITGCSLNDRNALSKICRKLKCLELTVIGTMGYDNAQVTAGGVSVREINNETMESKKHEGLYIIGELLDIDGNCGGYNLHFAFASGAACGRHIGGLIK